MINVGTEPIIEKESSKMIITRKGRSIRKHKSFCN